MLYFLPRTKWREAKWSNAASEHKITRHSFSVSLIFPFNFEAYESKLCSVEKPMIFIYVMIDLMLQKHNVNFNV